MCCKMITPNGLVFILKLPSTKTPKGYPISHHTAHTETHTHKYMLTQYFVINFCNWCGSYFQDFPCILLWIPILGSFISLGCSDHFESWFCHPTYSYRHVPDILLNIIMSSHSSSKTLIEMSNRAGQRAEPVSCHQSLSWKWAQIH